ncbi:hypothetical protein E2562_034357 [Oryza meyeriana var. granulata]|uniref:Uncharacterized protein n=1 Tax=Oryza meyeriana var. granulata TaxID=110450 RepID=A0A6G1FF61_9ORYZ|nr:hypothetical protein E2562_034357 [Oryza meyeriana var. granulata]
MPRGSRSARQGWPLHRCRSRGTVMMRVRRNGKATWDPDASAWGSAVDPKDSKKAGIHPQGPSPQRS